MTEVAIKQIQEDWYYSVGETWMSRDLMKISDSDLSDLNVIARTLRQENMFRPVDEQFIATTVWQMMVEFEMVRRNLLPLKDTLLAR